MADADNVLVAGNGNVWVAPVGTAFPTTPVAAPAADWKNLGFISEDGVTLTDGKSVESIMAWQSFYAIRRIISSRELTLGFALREWKYDTVALAFGGGEVTTLAADAGFQYTPPSPEDLDERAMLIDWADGDKNYRWCVYRGMVTDNVETNLVRSAAADLPITFGVNANDAGEPWFFMTDDPALAPPAP